MYKDLKIENIKLKHTIEMQGQMIEELKLSVADLKCRLVRHDNYNTPPSQKKGPGWQDTKGKDDKKMRAVNPQKRTRGKKATRAIPASQNPPSSRSTPRPPVPNAAQATFP